MDTIENRTFDEIQVGEQAHLSRLLGKTDMELLSLFSGQFHGADTHSTPSQFQGMGGEALVASLIATRLPGPGSVILAQKLHYLLPMSIGDRLTATVEVERKRPEGALVVLHCRCVNQHEQMVLEGTVTVAAPTEKITHERSLLPEISLHRHHVFGELFKRCEKLEPIRCAVAHPCDRDAFMGAVEAAKHGLIIPVLVGPIAKIRAVAEAQGVNLNDYEVVDVEHSHAAAQKAVAMARAGEVEGLMKGSLHTDELMAAVVPSATGLRTARRVSHVFVMDVPAYDRPLLITDAAININPTLEDKRDIVQSAIELAHVMGIHVPKVAILSAVETVNPKIPSTLEAAALCKMADRGQITGGVLDGPLAFDNAISMEAARTKKIISPVAGQAHILLVPDLEAGNMVAKQLSYFAGADSAGIVLGTRVPMVLTSRADTVKTRLASTALLLLVAHARRQNKGAGHE